MAGHSHVIHLAGLISYWKRDRRLLDRVNREGVRCVVEACLAEKVERLVHVSSVGAIGFHRDGTPADEETPFNWPDSLPYMTSKRDGQQVVEAAVRARGLPARDPQPGLDHGPGRPRRGAPRTTGFTARYGAVPCSARSAAGWPWSMCAT